MRTSLSTGEDSRPSYRLSPYLKPSLFGARMNYINTHATSTSAGDLAECRCAWSFPAIKLELSSLNFHWRGRNLARLLKSISAEPLQRRWTKGSCTPATQSP